jgi:hypothetical protein
MPKRVFFEETHFSVISIQYSMVSAQSAVRNGFINLNFVTPINYRLPTTDIGKTNILK